MFVNFSMPIERKLAAIMFTDIAGYTAQMSKDEAVAISLLNKKESILKPLIAKHNGTYVKSTGDGSLSHFNSAVDAATCAKRFQESIYDDKDLNVRVGVHLGDTIFEKGDIRGDGVNIASRLESMAVAGGVFVSKEVHDQLANQKEFEGVSLGLQSMKGVGRLIEVYGLKGDKLSEPNPKEYQDNKIDKHSDDEVPSIAIIPFDNKGADEDVFYAYGISADLISDCSSAGLIRVASLSDIEKLDYTNLDNTELSEKLLVRYISQGTLWKMGDMFQLAIELYDTKDKKVVWSDRWQEDWDNLPTIKGNLSDGLLKALDMKPTLEKKIETTHTEAYEYYLRAKHKYAKRENTDDTEIARGLLNKAIELDETLILAKVLLGTTYYETGDYDEAMENYFSSLKQAEELGDKFGIGYSLSSIGSVYKYKGDLDKSLEYFRRSHKIYEEIDNKSGIASMFSEIGGVYTSKGDLNQALKYFEISLKIDEELDDKYGIEINNISIGRVYKFQGNLDKALEFFKKPLKTRKKLSHKFSLGLILNNIGTIHKHIGDYDKALDCYKKSLKIRKELDDKFGEGQNYINIGNIYYDKTDYDNALEYQESSLKILNKIGLKENKMTLWAKSCLYLTYKKLKIKYDKNDIYIIIKKLERLDYDDIFMFHQLLEDTSYLETAYNQVQEKADNLEPDVAAKFLSYPIPKAIVEEWEKVK